MERKVGGNAQLGGGSRERGIMIVSRARTCRLCEMKHDEYAEHGVYLFCSTIKHITTWGLVWGAIRQ